MAFTSWRLGWAEAVELSVVVPVVEVVLATIMVSMTRNEIVRTYHQLIRLGKKSMIQFN